MVKPNEDRYQRTPLGWSLTIAQALAACGLVMGLAAMLGEGGPRQPAVLREVWESCGAFAFGILAVGSGVAILQARPWRVDLQSNGVRVWRVLQAPRTVTWSMLRRGNLRFGRHLAGGDELLAQIDEHLIAEAVTDAEPLEAGEIVRWLGIHQDQTLVVAPKPSGVLFYGGQLWLFIACFVVPFLSSLYPILYPDEYLNATIAGLLWLVSPLWGGWLIYYPILWAVRLWPDARRSVTVSAYGLQWRHGRRRGQAGWDRVIDIRSEPRPYCGWLLYWSRAKLQADKIVWVECGESVFWFQPTDQHAGPLLRALKKLIAARRAGQRLPPSEVVTAAALSRAEPTEAVERGLTRTGG